MPDIQDVRTYWESAPLYSHELSDPGSPGFFREFDRIKRQDVERFALDYWEFPAFAERSVLDIGCGPGWLTVQYAAAGARVTGVDLTDAAVALAGSHLKHYGLDAKVQRANAEELPFEDGRFDLVVSSGVLHHTPDTLKAFREAFRVTRPGGRAKITLYRKGILHSPLVFPLTRAAMRLLSVRHPGADLGREATDVDDFVRQYDGRDNPVGIAKRDREWARDLEAVGFRVDGWEVHFFPRRFVPLGRYVPSAIHGLLDRQAGTMVYFNLTKP